jgi:hypothetical protein
MGYFTKPLAELDASDIHQLVTVNETEGPDLEFKELALDASGGFKPAMRDKIAREIVAFATAEGGTLVLGIAETKSTTSPNRAESIKPIPACESMADRLARSMRDTIEPPIRHLLIRGIATETDGGGVIVVEVPRARQWLHRVKETKVCAVRHGTEAREINMREINELVLMFANEPNRIETRFSAMKERSERFAAPILRASSTSIAIRTTAVPVSPLQLQIAHRKDFKPAASTVTLQVWNKLEKQDGPVHMIRDRWWSAGRTRRPILRGVSFKDDRGDEERVLEELFADGVASHTLVYDYSVPSNTHGSSRAALSDGWLIETVLATLFAADQLRTMGKRPDVEYWLDVSVHCSGAMILVPTGFQNGYRPNLDSNIDFPRYSVGDKSSFGEILTEIMTDLLHVAGCQTALEWSFEIEENT